MRKISIFLTALIPAMSFAQNATTTSTTTTTDGGMASQYASFLPLILIFGIFYILLIRPQQKRMRDHQALLSELKKGDEVVTGGGILGKITKAEGDTISVEIAKGVEVSVLKSTVTSVMGKTLPSDKKKNDNKALASDNVANDN